MGIEDNILRQKQEILHPEVEELEQPIKAIIEQLRDNIERGDFGLIIGDDTSGRIPTLILGNFIKTITEKRGLPKPKIIFVPGRLPRSEEGKEFIQKVSTDLKEAAIPNGRILIITETIGEGRALSKLTEVIRQLGFPYDIATIGRSADSTRSITQIQDLGGINLYTTEGFRIISGGFKRNGVPLPSVYKNPINGISRIITAESTTTSATKKNLPIEDQDARQELINEGRKDAAIVTDRLVSWYLTN